MKMYVGITDFDWFTILKQANCDEVNFWKPSGRINFKALNEGDLFLFKTHSPRNYIVGGGIFLKFSILPSSLAWDAFGIANGANSMMELNDRIYRYKKTDHFSDPDPQIGCIILSMPFYFDEKDWNSNIVQGKTYKTSEPIGLSLYKQVQDRLKVREALQSYQVNEDTLANRYGKEQIIRSRVGQGAFKVMIADSYHRRCAITGEKTLPVLEAAHIKPYSMNGPHEITNGLLLRSASTLYLTVAT
ncbi:HNH endonuclease [Sporolactobacillus laevolacticus]|uniref:HNH endonuclease n=1 Tax=Sporolactobacillus laevolacticus TaxID=33018 RepID=UPI0025B434A0|nr:HNH endonuclease [Sporolactobacillus laevolacticus]MDN3956170.1 HNH endonuclease [Sporolactobacillus laevolacticus]